MSTSGKSISGRRHDSALRQNQLKDKEKKKKIKKKKRERSELSRENRRKLDRQ